MRNSKSHIWTVILTLSLTTFLLNSSAFAAFTPDIGARVSVVGAQELLVAPPLPSLDAGGISYRFIGDSRSAFAAGIFLGPAVMKSNASFKLESDRTEQYDFDQLMYGPYGGLQFKIALGPLIINPYGLYMHELTDKCKKISTNGPGFTGLCKADSTIANSVDMNVSFAGYGLFLGYKALRFNVYSKATSDSSFNDVKITAYSLSYGFEI